MTATPVDKLAAPPQRRKRSPASLFGGIACGIAAFVLSLLLAGGPSPLNIALGLVAGLALGLWVRLADL